MPAPGNNYLLGAHRHITRLGSRIVKNYQTSQKDRDRGGKCFKVTYDRIQEATQQVGDGRPLAPVTMDGWYSAKHRMFYAIWGSHIEIGREKWKQIPDVFRGRGAPAAMVGDGRAHALLEADQIWAGALEPGAVLQTWKNFDDYIRVVNGDASRGSGHSFIHKNYVYDHGGAIVGMKVIDNGHHGTETIGRGKWGYWAAANLRCLGSGATPRIPDPWWPEEESAESEEVAEPAHYGPQG